MEPLSVVELADAPGGTTAILQGNIAFGLGCARGGVGAADGYPGTPSTEVIDKALRYLQDRMSVGWSVNEAQAVAVGMGHTMAGVDAVVTMKVPGLFQAGDVVSTAAGFSGRRGGLVLYVATDFAPSSTQHVFDPRYFLKSCFLPVLEPRNHREMLEVGPLAAMVARECRTVVIVLASGRLCHSEALVALPPRKEIAGPEPARNGSLRQFMVLPAFARKNYDEIIATRMKALRDFALHGGVNHIEWHSRSLGVIVHGVTAMHLREAWSRLPVKPSVLSLGLTFPLSGELIRGFVDQIEGPVVVLGDGFRFVQEELATLGIAVDGKSDDDPATECSPDRIAERLGAVRSTSSQTARPQPVPRPPGLCSGCPFRPFAHVVAKLRRKGRLTLSLGDIGCNTLLFFLKGVDTCVCMGASDANRQGLVLSDPSLAGSCISVIGDSTECHSGLDATRNACFRNTPGVKVILDNMTTAMTGGQPAPSSSKNLAGEAMLFDLVAALKGEGAAVCVVDAYDVRAVERSLSAALDAATRGVFTALVVRGPCVHQVPAHERNSRFRVDRERCTDCGQCLVCPGIQHGGNGRPRFTRHCNGCGGHEGLCAQLCGRGAILPCTEEEDAVPGSPPLLSLKPEPVLETVAELPKALRVAVRGVGGQGVLFFGKVLAQVARLAGFETIVKGDTHGMAQRGGEVISTFGCGDVYAPWFCEGSVDTLVALEGSEVLRPGFIELARPDGIILLNATRIIPPGSTPGTYPTTEAILGALEPHRFVRVDGEAIAASAGDRRGVSTNAVILGVLSTLSPWNKIPPSLWRRGLLAASGSGAASQANLRAFEGGRAVGDDTAVAPTSNLVVPATVALESVFDHSPMGLTESSTMEGRTSKQDNT